VCDSEVLCMAKMKKADVPCKIGGICYLWMGTVLSKLINIECLKKGILVAKTNKSI